MRFNSNTLEGTSIGMYNLVNDDLITTFTSIGKAGRTFGYQNRGFEHYVYKRKPMNVKWQNKDYTVYFKEL